MAVRLAREAWDELNLALLVRSGGRCEARTAACLAEPDGRLAERRDGRSVAHSRHHRLPRGMGGSALPGQHGLDRLLLLCGDGVAGCHGWVESHREEARRRGLLVAHGVDPGSVAVELSSGQLVLLDASGGFYIPAGWRF
jgi:hypothetical protein